MANNAKCVFVFPFPSNMSSLVELHEEMILSTLVLVQSRAVPGSEY